MTIFQNDDQMMEFVSDRVESILWKWENAGY